METVTVKQNEQHISPPVETREFKGLLNAKWLWRELSEAKTEPQIYAVLAKVSEALAGHQINVQVELSPESYIRIMGDAWFARVYGEIDEMSMRAYIDRALQLMELNLKSIAVKRRS